MDAYKDDLHTVPTHIEVRGTFYLQQADLHIARWVAYWSIAWEIALIGGWSLGLVSNGRAPLLFLVGPILIWAASLVEVQRLNIWQWLVVLLRWSRGPHRMVRGHREKLWP